MFEKFDLIKYSLTNDGKTLKDYVLTDITTRARLRAPDAAFMTFKLRDGEMPEDVSNEVYGTPYYHWVIMMINEIFDVNNEWLMTDSQLHQFAADKYNLNYAMQITDINVTTDTFTVVGHKLNPNDVVTFSGMGLPGGLFENTEYYVYNTTANTFQLTTTLSGITPVNLTSAPTAVTNLECARMNYPAYYLDDQDNIMSTALDLFQGWSNNETTNTTYINQMNLIIAAQPSKNSYIPAQSKSVTDVGIDVIDVVEQVTPPEMLATRALRVITNFEYEEMMNEKRRVVFVLKPEYMKNFIDQFNKAVQS